MNINTCTNIPDRIVAPTTDWRKVVENNVAKHGIKWINTHYIGVTLSFLQSKRNKGKPLKRPGVYRDKVAEGSRAKGGNTGKSRNLQKESKKTNCKAKWKVVCYKTEPTAVEILHLREHNHDVASFEELKYLPLSQERKKANRRSS
ncbi:MAG: hypothetical protein EXX96DRAFT_616212 [Benjaminiella poitrasii]|nr:MAG: hypothetical protein EXX96DRAFT_616212 [Benjaminiella poitrasii]